MRLADWLKNSGTDVKGFAARLGVHFTNVYRYIAGTRRPRMHVLQRIAALTSGSVLPQDFYELPTPSPGASGLRALPPPVRRSPGTAVVAAAVPGASKKRKRNHSHASKKAWRSRKRRAAARSASVEARP